MGAHGIGPTIDEKRKCGGLRTRLNAASIVVEQRQRKGMLRLRPLPRCALAAKFLVFQAINGLVMIWMMYVTDGRWPTTIHTTVYAPLREIIVLIVVPSF